MVIRPRLPRRLNSRLREAPNELRGEILEAAVGSTARVPLVDPERQIVEAVEGCDQFVVGVLAADPLEHRLHEGVVVDARTEGGHVDVAADDRILPQPAPQPLP